MKRSTPSQAVLAVAPSEKPICLNGVPAELLPLYQPLATAKRFVIGQVGQSLDGRVATASGDARDISGSAGLKHLHRLRALADAVIVGAGTVVHDDPRLTVREVQGASPARIVIDPNGRVPNEARVFGENGARRVVFQCGQQARPLGVETIRLEGGVETLCVRTMIAKLADLGFSRLLVEGGARTLGPFLNAGLLDRLQITISPLIIGDGPVGIALPPERDLAHCRRPRTRFFDLGGEIVADCDFGAHAGSASTS